MNQQQQRILHKLTSEGVFITTSARSQSVAMSLVRDGKAIHVYSCAIDGKLTHRFQPR